MENKTMNKRVYGILGISSVMGNWNADFGYGLSMLEKNLDSDRRIIVVSGDMRADGNVVFTYGDRVKGYIIG